MNKKNYLMISKILTAMLTLVLCILTSCITSEARSYNYSGDFRAIPAPDAYEWQQSIRGTDIGTSEFLGLTDLYYKNAKLYIAMTGRIVVVNENFELVKIIENYKTDEGIVPVSNPTSIFVTDENHIYIAEEALGKIIELDDNYLWIRTLENPCITGLEEVKYQPSKVVVDKNGRIFVKAKSVYEGIIELNPDGVYTRFVGANKVEPDLGDIVYRKFATDEQLARMTLWLPTDYSDLAIDKDGFLMATVKDNEAELPIRKLNSAGSNILYVYDNLPWAAGDIKGKRTISTLTTISTCEDGRFAALDVTRNRVFVYSQDGLLAYEFGGIGKQEGSFNSPVDVCFMGDYILIADLVSKTIEVFETTTYGEMVNAALRAQGDYDYELAAHYWKQVYDIYPESLIANLGLGKQAIREEEFEKAMDYFRACEGRENYSAAYERVREEWLNKNLGIVIIVLILFVLIVAILKRIIRNMLKKDRIQCHPITNILKKIKYTVFTWPGYVLKSPFKAFDDIKYENAGSTVFSIVIFVLFAWASLIKAKYSGFIVNYHTTESINVPILLISSVVPYIIFIVANWAVGTLIDGKGNFVQVLKFTAYAIYPTIYFWIVGTIISNWIIYDERMLVQFLFVFPTILFAFYCFIGIVTIHQFSFTKGVVSVLISFVAMIIIIFIIVLFTTMVSQFSNDIMTMWDEFSLYHL